MGWEGQVRWTSKVGAPVSLGNVAVPRSVTLTGTGDGHHPDLKFVFEVSDHGEARCVEALVLAKKHGRGVRTADLALINVDHLTSSAFHEFAQELLDETDTAMSTAMRSSTPAGGHPAIWRALNKGKGTTHAELLDVAWIYVTADHAPMKTVEVKLGMTRRTAARRIDAARQVGLLPPKGEVATDEFIEHIKKARADVSKTSATGALPLPEMRKWLGWDDRPEVSPDA